MASTRRKGRAFSMRAMASALFVLSAQFLGCSREQAAPPATIDCTATPPDSFCDSDADGDGLPYGTEVVGWMVYPDRFGRGLGVDDSGEVNAFFRTTSDPNQADTDGDGRTDFQEFLDKTDPRSPDTDADGLTDKEEIERFGTNALAVDSDGDARGPNGDLAPNTSLFDAAELKIDLLGDPTHTPGAGATSPILADTDGDRRSDWTEKVEGQESGFDPTLADLPQVAIQLASSPIIRLVGSWTSGREWSHESTVTNSLSESIESEASVSRTTEMAITSTVTVGGELGFEFGKDKDGWGGKGSAKVSASYSTASALTNSEAVSWTWSNARAAETAYQESKGEGSNESVSLTGGWVSVSVAVANTGKFSYSLVDLRVNLLARGLDGTSSYAPVLELKREDDTPVVLAPGQSYGNVLLRSDTTDYELIRSLLRSPSGLLFEVSSYDVTDVSGQSFAFSAETVKQRTAVVVIDYGGRAQPGRYLVATRPSRDPDGRDGVTVATVLRDILGIAYETTEKTDGSGTAYHVLSSVTPPGALAPVAGSAAANEKWLPVLATDRATDVEDFDTIRVHAGDSLYLMFVADGDRDGLSDREEALSGTRDDAVDTDGDGVGDFEEIRTGWTVGVAGRTPYTAFPRGYAGDSDHDGVDDPTEKACGLDPARTDTDQDGIGDRDELYGFDVVDATSALVTHVFPYAGPAILDGGDGVADTVPGGDDVLLATSAVQGSVLIGPGPNGVLDTTPAGDDYVGAAHTALPPGCNGGTYATDPLSGDTDGDGFPDGFERSLALGSPNDGTDVASYVDSDGDGLTDAAEEAGFSSIVNGSWARFTSDPALADTDQDGLPDGQEAQLGTNPRSADTDGDSLSDQEESVVYETNPTAADSDADGLTDRAEIDGWDVDLVVTGGTWGTRHVTSDPWSRDTDSDGLTDSTEKEWLDPRTPDTDGDGLDDGAERTTCATPLNPPASRTCRDPIVPDMIVRLYMDSIASGADDGFLSDGSVRYRFGFTVNGFFYLNTCEVCGGGCGSSSPCTSIDFTGDLPLGWTLPMVFPRFGYTYSVQGKIEKLNTGIDCTWFGSCVGATWTIVENVQSEDLWAARNRPTATTWDILSAGRGSGALGDDVVRMRYRVE